MGGGIKPLVSVAMITYNHEAFILEAIEGVLMQETTFEYELIIANDCSTDQTNSKIEKLIQSHPKSKLIKYFNHQTNLGMMSNAIFTLEKCGGKYIANCEGDDYWTDPLKLQKQVDFLEKNKDYIISCHNALIINDKGDVINPSKIPPLFQRDFMPVELMKVTPILTLTAVYRNKVKNLPIMLKNSPNLDTAIFSYLGQFGKSKFHHDIKPAVYRVHEGGVWSTKSAKEKNRMQLQTFNNLAQYFKNTIYKEVALHFQQRVLYINTLIVNESTSWSKVERIFNTFVNYIKKGELKQGISFISIYFKNSLLFLKNKMKIIS
jgi:glycosyltransferase involved in cell wall biosynthesis